MTSDTERHDEAWLDAWGVLPDGVPSHWSVYFGVDDADAALTEIVELAGSVRRAAEPATGPPLRLRDLRVHRPHRPTHLHHHRYREPPRTRRSAPARQDEPFQLTHAGGRKAKVATQRGAHRGGLQRRAAGVWTYSNVRDVLSNPKHTGHMVWNRRARKIGHNRLNPVLECEGRSFGV